MIPSSGRLSAYALGLMACCALACTSVPVNLSEHAEGTHGASGRELSVRGCGFQLFSVIPIATNNRKDRAYRAIVRQASPNAVIRNVKVQERWYWTPGGNVYCTRITATAYPRR